MKQTARGVALDALLSMENNEGYSNLVIDQALRSANLERRDAALASTIFYGVLERKLTLDYYLKSCLKDPKKKLDKVARMALRCGAYQICYLDRIPDSAAVNETVNVVKARGKSSLSGFVNGVLRNLIRNKESLQLPDGDDVRALSLRYSIPQELILLWQRSYGTEVTRNLLDSFEERSELFLRVNPLKTTTEELKASLEEQSAVLETVPFLPGAAILQDCGSPVSLPQFAEGLFHVQDLSAQLVCEILNPQPGETVCDCCAAPGGKSFTMAEKMNGAGSVFALDLHPGRVKLIDEGAKRLGLSNITAKAADMTKPIEDIPKADKVLCDVPCSGFGVIRRKPEIRYKSLASVKELPGLQYDILRNAAGLLKPGGVLVYSTCTLNPAENGEVAKRFLEENPGFLPMSIDLPNIRRATPEPDHHFTMMPFSGASDGFFAAAFIKKEA